jgi:UDP-N-acetylglucosamine diphosphorylase/glucosamine-1-phosphate N-acetyltransferase
MALDLLLIYEDESWQKLWPLSAARPVYDIRVGAFRMWEKQRHAFQPRHWAVSAGSGRTAVTRAFSQRNGVPDSAVETPARGVVLWWNGAAFPPRVLPALTANGTGLRLHTRDGRVVGLLHNAGSVTPAEARRLLESGSELPAGWGEERVETGCLSAPWDLLHYLHQELDRDLDVRLHDVARSQNFTGVHIEGTRFATGHGVQIDPGVVIDTRPGAVFLHEEVRIEALTHLVGPAYIGPRTQLLGGRVSTVAMGPECRIGGEVDTVLFQGFANKRHQGFLGHAVIGEWVNLGAMTTNSDLKNNYGTVRVWLEGRTVDSGEQKVGCFLGDHVKTGIGTLFTTGCVVGPGSNLFGGGAFTPRYLPGWSWWDGETTVGHQWEKFLETARTALGRRQETLDDAQAAALREAFDNGPTTGT